MLIGYLFFAYYYSIPKGTRLGYHGLIGLDVVAGYVTFELCPCFSNLRQNHKDIFKKEKRWAGEGKNKNIDDTLLFSVIPFNGQCLRCPIVLDLRFRQAPFSPLHFPLGQCAHLY